jgi:hypothetical protein
VPWSEKSLPETYVSYLRYTAGSDWRLAIGSGFGDRKEWITYIVAKSEKLGDTS